MKTWDERAGNYLTWREGFSFNLIKRNLIYTPILKMILKKKLKEINPKLLLEVGCGPGRLFDLYNNIESVCIDSSEKMLVRANGLMENKKHSNITLLLMDICNQESFFKKFDLFFDVVITSNVLLHIPHNKIDAAIKNICGVAINVICVEWVEPNANEREGCYLHDYESLFGKHGFFVNDSLKIPFEKQIMYHFVSGGE